MKALALAMALAAAPATCPVLPDADDPQATLPKCSAVDILEGQGVNCITITITNGAGATSGSEMSVTVTWDDNTTSNDVLPGNQSKTYSCKIKKITCHEKKIDIGLVRWHIS